MADAHTKPHHDYHLVDPSPWPAVGAVSAFLLAVGAISWMHQMTAAAPFIFGFSDESAPTAVFIAGGVAYLLVSVGTRYLKEEETLRDKRRLRRGRKRAPESRGPLEEPPEFEVPPRGEKR